MSDYKCCKGMVERHCAALPCGLSNGPAFQNSFHTVPFSFVKYWKVFIHVNCWGKNLTTYFACILCQTTMRFQKSYYCKRLITLITLKNLTITFMCVLNVSCQIVFLKKIFSTILTTKYHSFMYCLLMLDNCTLWNCHVFAFSTLVLMSSVYCLMVSS